MSQSPPTSIEIAPQGSGNGILVALLCSRRFQLLSLVVYAFVLNREGDRVPSGNELVYLLYVFKAWHPHFLAGDWTFVEPTAGHGIFNLTTGWLTLFMPLHWAAWIGRFACWTLTFVALLRLGQHFKIPSWAVWLGLLLWMVQRQALPTTALTEWIVGSFEAKVPGYICLIFALDAALRGRVVVAGLLAGLAFSFHSAVGMWGGAAIGWMILLQAPIRKTILFCACAAVAAIPGLVSSLPLIMGSHRISAIEARFLVTQGEPVCMDPFSMAWPYVALLLLMLGFAGLYRWKRGGQTASCLWQFQLALAVIFVLGFVARAAGRFDMVKLFPMRVFTVLIPLFFFWQLGWVLLLLLERRKRSEPSLMIVAIFGLVVFLALPSPVALLAETLASHVHSVHWAQSQAVVASDDALESTVDFRSAASWVARNTPVDDVVIAPPWRADAFYFIRRPLIANWHAYRYDAMTEWRKRIEALAGDLSDLTQDDADLGPAHRAHYRNLTAAEILVIQHQFNAGWLITTADYPFERPFTSGVFKVYKLPGAGEKLVDGKQRP